MKIYNLTLLFLFLSSLISSMIVDYRSYKRINVMSNYLWNHTMTIIFIILTSIGIAFQLIDIL